MGKPGANEMDEDGVVDLLQREVDLLLFPVCSSIVVCGFCGRFGLLCHGEEQSDEAQAKQRGVSFKALTSFHQNG